MSRHVSIFGRALALFRTLIFSKKVTPNGHSPTDFRTLTDFDFLAGVARDKKCAERTLRACPSSLGRISLLIIPLSMGSPHNLPNNRGLSAYGLHMLLNPDRRHYRFLEIVIL